MEDSGLFYCVSKEATPMMAQYFSIKSQYPGCILLFRMGDFYELFFDDAKIASSLLNIALTTRGKHMECDIPMCGVPVVSVDNYLQKLVKYGHKVAICEQTEDPKEAKKRGYKTIVNREVTRIVTPGTVIEDSLLRANKHNFLMAAVADINKKTSEIKVISFSAIDITTGDFFVNSVLPDEFSAILEMYQPKEMLMPSRHEGSALSETITSTTTKCSITFLPDSKFNPTIEEDRLKKYFKVNTLDSFEISVPNELAVCGAILEYLIITQRGGLPTLPAPKKTSFSEYLVIDSSTSKSLEIVSSAHGEYRYTLLGAIDKTMTPFGARTLASRISTPIVSIDKISKRMDCVEFFQKNEKMCKLIRETLSGCSDFERAVNRIRFNKFSVRDVGDIREAVRVIEAIKCIISEIPMPSEGDYCLENVLDFSDLKKILEAALVAVLPVSNHRDNDIIASGYSKKLDELRYVKNHSEDLIANLQARYVGSTSINTLKIKNNAILGWYVEIPLSQKGKITEEFIHRQTLVNSVRYTSDELIYLQSKLSEALEEWAQMEQKIYLDIVEKILLRYDDISYAIRFLSCLDVYTNFATIATERNYIRPEIVYDPVLEIEEGKHPILENHVQEFTANDCDLSSINRICLLTGPNMAGKSTYLRQNALLIILAQIGCYVPAKKATIGIVDRLFSRIGASDDIARGRSTFMVEMIETATILNKATEKSFVILDEVGRGTSTYDGLSIAWAVIENLSKINRCRVLFATHYRELAALQNGLKSIKCKTLKVQEWNGDVVFYHKIIDGIADKSYGIHVACIAGVPKNVVKRATQLLQNFEKKEVGEGSESFNPILSDIMPVDQLSLSYTQDDESKLRDRIRHVDLNRTTPRDALNMLYELREMLF